MPDFDIDVTTLVYGGDGMGRLPDGRAVFVPFGLPGEQIRVRLMEEKRNFARGVLLKVLKASPERIQPRCRHYGVCGGCHYQHLDYPSQLRVKTDILRDQLTRIAGIANPPLAAMIPSPMEWNYRNAVQFHPDPAGKLGFQAADGRGVVAISECHLPAAALCDFWPLFDLEPVPGLERVSLRLGDGEDILVGLEGEELEPPELSVEELAVSVVQLSSQGATVLAGDESVFIEVLERSFRVSAGSFFQVNTVMAAQMVRLVLASLPVDKTKVVLDLYCGVGLFSAFLAPLANEVIGVELAPSACEDFAVNLDEFENVSLYEGAAEQVLPALDRAVDLAVVDPPRGGLERAALDALVKLQPAQIAYVSCDPATLARDAKRLLAAGYRLEQVTPLDMFPQTYHIESISLFQWGSATA